MNFKYNIGDIVNINYDKNNFTKCKIVFRHYDAPDGNLYICELTDLNIAISYTHQIDSISMGVLRQYGAPENLLNKIVFLNLDCYCIWIKEGKIHSLDSNNINISNVESEEDRGGLSFL